MMPEQVREIFLFLEKHSAAFIFLFFFFPLERVFRSG